MAHYQGYCVDNVIQILEGKSKDANYTLSKEYVSRSGQMIGEVDDGTLILELYPSNNFPSEDNQMESEHPQPQILYVDHELAIVVLWTSIWDYLQLVGVDDPKQDWGEVTKVCDDGSTQLWLSDGVGIWI